MLWRVIIFTFFMFSSLFFSLSLSFYLHLSTLAFKFPSLLFFCHNMSIMILSHNVSSSRLINWLLITNFIYLLTFLLANKVMKLFESFLIIIFRKARRRWRRRWRWGRRTTFLLFNWFLSWSFSMFKLFFLFYNILFLVPVLGL